MSKKSNSKTLILPEDENPTHEYNVSLSHCDSSSVCFVLEENATLYQNLTAKSMRSEDNDNSISNMNCNCLKYNNVDKSQFTCPCDNNFILEYFGSICAPALSLFFEQGCLPNYYFSQAAGHSVWVSSSHYLGIYDHNISEHRRGHVIPTTPLTSIVEWDNPRREPHFFRFEHIDYGALFYREHFLGRTHTNYVGLDPTYGPFCISIIKCTLERKINTRDSAARKTTTTLAVSNENSMEKNYDKINDKTCFNGFRVIARFINIFNFRGVIPALSQPEAQKPKNIDPKNIDRILIQNLFPRLLLSSIISAPNDKSFQDELLKFDEDCLSLKHKIGVIYCGRYQTTESEMYSNNAGSVAYQSFLELLGNKITLKNFEGFAGMLDTKTDSSGVYSIYTKFKNREIMFHVSTLIPCDPNNSQQITRKRYIGNDMVTIIFQDEGSWPFSPKSFVSQFQHVFIVIQAVMNKDKLMYRIAVFRLKDVPCFGPYITQEFYVPDQYFRHFLLTKIINAEYACLKANKFIYLNRRTRYRMLLELKKISESVVSDKSSKFSDIFRSGSQNKIPKSYSFAESYILSNEAVIWQGAVYNASLEKWIDCAISVSVFCVSLISVQTKEIILTVLSKYLLAFKFLTPIQVKIFHRAGNYFVFRFNKDDTAYVSNFLNRLTAVSNITEAQNITFNPPEIREEFQIDDYAIVKKVPSNQSGMNKLNVGDQILEIESISLSVLSLKKFMEILFEGGWKRLMVAQMKTS